MRTALFLLFGAILVGMVAVTTYASLHTSIWNVRGDLVADPWFHATLADAYFGFLTFYVWVCYKERNVGGRVVWFVLIMLLGNIAMSIYVLWRLYRLPPEADWTQLLLRETAPTSA